MIPIRPPLECWLRFNEARDLLGCSRTMMNRMLSERTLKGGKLKGTWRFLPEDIAACKVSQAERLQRAANKRARKLDSKKGEKP